MVAAQAPLGGTFAAAVAGKPPADAPGATRPIMLDPKDPTLIAFMSDFLDKRDRDKRESDAQEEDSGGRYGGRAPRMVSGGDYEYSDGYSENSDMSEISYPSEYS